MDGRHAEGDRVQDPREREKNDAGRALRRQAPGHSGERPRDGADVLGDGAPANLLGSPAAQFVSFSERDGRGGVIGRELLDYVGVIFEYWDQVKVDKLTRSEFRDRMAPVRKNVDAVLQRAVAAKLKSVSGSCENILEHAAALWTFVDVVDVEPTNNHAERELRAFVLWRRRSFGSQSERGNLFAERLMTVVHTARKQNKNVLTFLTASCTAARDGKHAPSLFAA